MNGKVVMLCSDCFSTVAIYNAMVKRHAISRIITEEPLRGSALAKRRIKKLGWWKAGGQILFSLAVVPFIRKASKKRMAAIQEEYAFDITPLPANEISHVDSVNSEACIRLLKELTPDVVIVNGTRIISKKVLESTKAVFINMHTGITPKYRGVHGGYWAMAKNDAAHCGVTIHLVDKGIDTGAVLYQALIPVTRADNYHTYPYLQFGEGIPLMVKAVEDSLRGQLSPKTPMSGESALWYHPTIWFYLWNRIRRGVK